MTHDALVRVSAPGGAPLAGATVACVCEPTGDAGAVTDENGLAELTIFNSEPESCVVTTAKVGYQTEQLRLDELGVELDVELEHVP